MVRGLPRIGGILAVVAVVMLPGILIERVGLGGAASVWGFGAITAVIALLTAGVRATAGMAAALAAAATVAGLASDRPWLALLLMAACSAGMALTAERGLNSAFSMAPISIAFLIASPPALPSIESSLGKALAMGGVMLAAAGWGALVVHVAGRNVHLPHPDGVTRRTARRYAAILAVLVGASTWVVVDRGLGHGGAWMIMTILIVVQPDLRDTWVRTLQRAGGTVLGFVIALATAAVIRVPWVYLILGLAFFIASLAVRSRPGRPYWLYVTLLTPAVVMLEGAQGSVIATDLERLAYTLLGVTVSLAATAVLVTLGRVRPHRTAPRSAHTS